MEPNDIRVAIFSGNYNYTRDGANQALNLLVGHLLSRGVKVRVYSPTTKHPAFAPTGDLVSVPGLSMPGGRDEYKLARGLPAQTRADLRAFDPNVVHVSAPDILGHRAISWARRNDIATLASLHTRFETYPRYYGIGFLEPLVIRLLTRFYNRVDHVVVPGQSMADIIHGWGVNTPTSIWSRGCNHDRFNPARRSLEWRRSLGIGDQDFAVSFLGRLVLEKGLRFFAEVLAELKRRGVPHKVLVIGKGPAEAEFAEMVPEAIFAGFQAGDDLGRAVASMDLLFNPSLTETFGNVTLEAIAAGVPVVAADAPGARDILVDGETGFLVPPRDISAYADAIQRLCAEPGLRDKMGAAGHAASAPYVWDRVNEAVLDAYRDILDRRAGVTA